MKKKHVISAGLLVLLCTSLYAQRDFFELVATGSSARVLAAIREGANATDGDRLGVTPLMAAAARNPDPQIVALLLAAGARVGGRDAMEETPLMYAARSNPNVAVIRSLLEAGANVNDRNFFGTTALMMAAQFGTNPAVISLLLEAGADARQRNIDGMSAPALANANPHLRGTAALEELEHARK
jgi:uncharacterized protein